MDKTQKAKVQKNIRRSNILESLRDIGTNSAGSLLEQITGFYPEPQKYSGEITPGQSLKFNELFSGQHKENLKLQKQLTLERKLAEEERIQSQRKSNELRVQLQALIQQVVGLAKATSNLGQEIESAAMQAPAQPGIYHLVFFEKLLEMIISFRKKIEDASVWLSASNKRTEKKNYWAMYKKKGASFLLAPDHYLQRSAG